VTEEAEEEADATRKTHNGISGSWSLLGSNRSQPTAYPGTKNNHGHLSTLRRGKNVEDWHDT